MSNTEDYTVGWICAIEPEYLAAQLCLDEDHSDLEYHPSPNDTNTYTLGKISNHNVVIACLPHGSYGTSSAANVATNMLRSFPNVRIGLMVGIGGGAPTPNCDIRLGDIVVSSPGDGYGGVFQYDFGKTIQEQDFQVTGFLNRPPTTLLTAVTRLKVEYRRKPGSLEKAIDLALQDEEEELREELTRPDETSDTLYQSGFVHSADDNSPCAATCGLNRANVVIRPERTRRPRCPVVHYGLIASGNQLMKDALVRDEFAERWKVLCFEMEAAGLMNDFPCLVIRGICDYSDSHKNKVWQEYAALVAAVYTKDLLRQISPDQVRTEKKIFDVLSAVRKKVVNISNAIDTLVGGRHNDEQKAILDWLTPVDYISQHTDFIRSRQPGTGRWFLESAEYREWLDGNKRTLFCPGIPGAGKTIITSIVVDHLQAKFRDDQNTGIAYIYNNYRRQDVQKAEDLLASLLKQLIERSSSFPTGVKDLYDQHKKNKTRPSFDEISKTLHLVVTTYSIVFIVIDALDECEVSDRNKVLIEIFALQNNAHSGVNIIATSRIDDSIKKHFVGCPSLDIYASNDDIKSYVATQIKLRNTDLLDDATTRERVQSGVAEAAEGMFLLVKLHIETLLSQPTKGHLQEALLNLGKGMDGLDKTYEQAMERIEAQGHESRDLAIQILTWITHAERTLFTEELQHALAVRSDPPNTRRLNADFVPTVQVLLSLCAGLVTIDEISGIIRLVHFTTQEFFIRKKKFPNAHFDITKTCVIYLSFEVFGSGICHTDIEFEERLQSHKLYRYAAHFLQCSAVLQASSQALLAENSLYGSGYSQNFPKHMTGLHLAAYFGVGEAVEALIQKGVKSDASNERNQTPLLLAARNGHEAVVKLLLATGKVDIDSIDSSGWTPLSFLLSR